MKVSLKWLRDYVPVSLDSKELAHKLTMAGLEVGMSRRWGRRGKGCVSGR